MLVYDLQGLSVHFFPPAGTGDRERRVVTIARLIEMIEEGKQKTGPKWKRYYHRHRERELARQKAYRAAHRDEVREYNRQYYRSRKQRRAAAPGQAVLVQEAAKCST